MNLPAIDNVKVQGSHLCKELNSFSESIGRETIAKVNRFEQTSLNTLESYQFSQSLLKFGEESSFAGIV